MIKCLLIIVREEKQEKQDAAKTRKIKRLALIGLATVGGGVLIGMKQDRCFIVT